MTPDLATPLLSTTPHRREDAFELSTDFTCIAPQHGTRFMPSNVREINHHDSSTLMALEGITLDGHIHLHAFKTNTVTAVKYWDEVLEPYVRLFRGQ
ncbi:transposable element Tcb2 transposase [Trichonephila clavipes]|nr:transposable element Tcb2 transposase [Trichonephila clavipes]